MNPKPISETESIRSDIEMTRRRMDDTINALGERVQGRHLLDEVIGFFRNNSEKTSDTGTLVREKLSDTAGKLSETAGNAASAVADTVKKNPLPILLMTAGAAWLAYNATRKPRADVEDDLEDSDRYDPDTHYDRPLEYPGSNLSGAGDEGGSQDATDEASSTLSNLKDKASAATDQVKDKLAGVTDKARDKFQDVKQRASEFGSRVKDRASELGNQVGDRTRQVYGKARDSVAETSDQYPLQVGLGCLAVGVLIGLALPTPEPVRRIAGPTVDRLRTRAKGASQEWLQKGKRVAQAATEAAKSEAETQGLTMDRIRQGGKAVAERAANAATDTARQQGLPGTGGTNSSGNEPADPSAARPAS